MPLRLKRRVSQTTMPFATEQKFVVRAEQALGRRFPEAYVARMVQSNGGSVQVDDDEWVMHPIPVVLPEPDSLRPWGDAMPRAHGAQWRG